jgi:hypothetical protein
MKANILPISFHSSTDKNHTNMGELNTTQLTIQNARNMTLRGQAALSFLALQAKCRQFESVKLHQEK